VSVDADDSSGQTRYYVVAIIVVGISHSNSNNIIGGAT
jgi:hypothetical protein